MQAIPVILCGGSGTRLWPLSRSGFPKQFLVLSGTNSLFQQAVDRINAIGTNDIDVGRTIIVTNEEHRFISLDQLRELKDVSATLILESAGRNTAPALTLAALYAGQIGGEANGNPDFDPILVITPADQTIGDAKAFTKALQDSVRVANTGAIAILGITPTTPEVGYGYIQRSGVAGKFNDYAVVKFAEKPDIETAKRYCESGEYFWNSGMFVLKASVWLAAIREFRPDILEATDKAWQKRIIDVNVDVTGKTAFIRPDKQGFMDIPSDSIDYAVMERCPGSNFSIKMVELNAGWNDLGAWDAVWQAGSQDGQGNVVSGDVLLSGTRNSLIHSSGRLVSVVGMEDTIVVETADAVLVANKSKSQDVKQIVAMLEEQKRDVKNLHRKVARPWGWYDSIDEDDGFKVKRIQVRPGASLSLQMHHHRAEHWIVVRGVAEITNGDSVVTLTQNQSTYIPKGQTHRLANPGNELLEIIEVQSGSYLGEDDIVRFEDSYGRS